MVNMFIYKKNKYIFILTISLPAHLSTYLKFETSYNCVLFKKRKVKGSL